MKSLIPAALPAPFGRYAHGVLVPPGWRLLLTSGQLGLPQEGPVPQAVRKQAELCFAHIDAILAAAGAERAHVARINAYVTQRADMAGYMAARDQWLAAATALPASTLMIVGGFTRPEFKVEIEVTAAVPA
ncbi:MAG: RidA family protein [Pseudomonadota bacterium]